MRPLPEDMVFWTAGLAGASGLHHRPIHHGRVILTGHRVADSPAASAVRRLVDEHDTMRFEKIESGHTVVGKRADDFAVVETVIGKSIPLDYRPVGQIAKHEVRRILDAVLLLVARASTQRHVAAAADGVPTCTRLGFHEDDRVAGFAGHDRGGKPRGPRAHHNHVRLQAPALGRLRGLRALRPGEYRSSICGEATRRENQIAPADCHIPSPASRCMVRRCALTG